MALPPHFLDGAQPESHGVGLNLIPGDPPTFQVELQRAPDVSGSPGTWVTIQQLPPIRAATVFVDLLPADNTYRHYRWRHIGPGYDPSPFWSPVIKAKPERLEGAAATGGLISLYPLRREKPMNDGKYAPRATDPIGALIAPDVKLVPENGVFEGGVTHRLYRHREEIVVNGPDADGDVTGITFAQTYQNAPMLMFKGGQYVTFSDTLGTSVKQRVRIQAFDITAGGFKSRAQITNPGATTPQSDNFATGTIDAQGETNDADLTPGGANDDTYNVHYSVTVNAEQELAEPGSEVQVTLILAIKTNDGLGGGWIERATYQYQAIANDADPSVTNSWSEEIKAIVVSGLGTNDDIRLEAKSFTVVTIGGSSGTGSFSAAGGDSAGGNPGAFAGVTYNTASDSVESAIPNAGDNVVWVAQEVT